MDYGGDSEPNNTWDVTVSAAADVLETDMSSDVIFIIHYLWMYIDMIGLIATLLS